MDYDVIEFPKQAFNNRDCVAWLQQNDYKTYSKVKGNKGNFKYVCSHEVSGGNVWDEIVKRYKGIKMALKGVRTNIEPKSRKVIERNANALVKHVQVGRRPLGTMYDTILNIMHKASTGDFKPLDKFFHLYIICHLSNGQKVVVEKNEMINVKPYTQDALEEIADITQPISVSLTELLANGKKVMGEHDFYTYNAFSTNCQDFVYRVLVGNGIKVDSNTKKFILQNVDNLVPTEGKKIAYFMTSLYNRGKTAISGYGMSNSKLR